MSVQILGGIVARAGSYRCEQEFGRSHAFVVTVVGKRLVRVNLVAARLGLELHAAQVCDCEFHSMPLLYRCTLWRGVTCHRERPGRIISNRVRSRVSADIANHMLLQRLLLLSLPCLGLWGQEPLSLQEAVHQALARHPSME